MPSYNLGLPSPQRAPLPISLAKETIPALVGNDALVAQLACGSFLVPQNQVFAGTKDQANSQAAEFAGTVACGGENQNYLYGIPAGEFPYAMSPRWGVQTEAPTTDQGRLNRIRDRIRALLDGSAWGQDVDEPNEVSIPEDITVSMPSGTTVNGATTNGQTGAVELLLRNDVRFYTESEFRLTNLAFIPDAFKITPFQRIVLTVEFGSVVVTFPNGDSIEYTTGSVNVAANSVVTVRAESRIKISGAGTFATSETDFPPGIKLSLPPGGSVLFLGPQIVTPTAPVVVTVTPPVTGRPTDAPPAVPGGVRVVGGGGSITTTRGAAPGGGVAVPGTGISAAGGPTPGSQNGGVPPASVSVTYPPAGNFLPPPTGGGTPPVDPGVYPLPSVPPYQVVVGSTISRPPEGAVQVPGSNPPVYIYPTTGAPAPSQGSWGGGQQTSTGAVVNQDPVVSLPSGEPTTGPVITSAVAVTNSDGSVTVSITVQQSTPGQPAFPAPISSIIVTSPEGGQVVIPAPIGLNTGTDGVLSFVIPGSAFFGEVRRPGPGGTVTVTTGDREEAPEQVSVAVLSTVPQPSVSVEYLGSVTITETIYGFQPNGGSDNGLYGTYTTTTTLSGGGANTGCGIIDANVCQVGCGYSFGDTSSYVQESIATYSASGGAGYSSSDTFSATIINTPSGGDPVETNCSNSRNNGCCFSSSIPLPGELSGAQVPQGTEVAGTATEASWTSSLPAVSTSPATLVGYGSASMSWTKVRYKLVARNLIPGASYRIRLRQTETDNYGSQEVDDEVYFTAEAGTAEFEGDLIPTKAKSGVSLDDAEIDFP